MDLKFPAKPVVSLAAKDLISQVFHKSIDCFEIQQLVVSGLTCSFDFMLLGYTDACKGFFSASAPEKGT